MATEFEIQAGLAAPFPVDGIEWRVGTVSKNKPACTLLAYLTARAVMDRLDEVVGPLNWRDEYTDTPSGAVRCCISIRDPVTGEWVGKWDAADPTNVEATKGGHSDAFKRAAVKWGIGRYLYKLDAQWVRLEKGWGPFGSIGTKWPPRDSNVSQRPEPHHVAEMPRLPAWALPPGESGPRPANRKPTRNTQRVQQQTRADAIAEITKLWDLAGLIPLPNWLDSIEAPGLQQWSDEALSRLLADLKAGNTPQGAAA